MCAGVELRGPLGQEKLVRMSRLRVTGPVRCRGQVKGNCNLAHSPRDNLAYHSCTLDLWIELASKRFSL